MTPTRWPFEDIVAPAALSVRDTMYLMQSTFEPRPILFSTAPASGRLEFYNRLLPPLPRAMHNGALPPWPKDSIPPGPWDPDLFHDPDSDRWYLYWGSSNEYPLYGIEMDKSKHLTYMGEPRPLLSLHPELHGWERFGRNHGDTIHPYVEGSWMTKHGGKYYLQYAAPGTEYNVYANGTYVGDSALGPFTYAPYNPVSYKPGGFATGAGHGNTFEDAHGNFWNTGTTWIGSNWNFERRIVMFPAGFDGDGDMYADTRFGDFPHRMPTARWQRSSDLFLGWMLLSYRKPARATSEREGFRRRERDRRKPAHVLGRARHLAARVDHDRSRQGEHGARGAGEFRGLRVGEVRERYRQCTRDFGFRRRSTASAGAWWLISRARRAIGPTRMSSSRTGARALRPLRAPARGRGDARDQRYSRVRQAVADRCPRTPDAFTAVRDGDPRNAHIEWEVRVAGAVGYNIRWGIAA